MSELTNYEQFKDLNCGEVIFHINPYGYGSKIQNKVRIKKFTISHVNKKGRLIDTDGEKLGFVSDMLRGVKKTFKSSDDAEKYLSEVHNGRVSESVEEHHWSCARC